MDKLQGLLSKFKEQNFRPDDSVIASAINHPINGLLNAADWFKDNVNTAAGLPKPSSDEGDIYSYGPSREDQIGAANNLTELMQTGALPFAPTGSGGLLGTITKPSLADIEQLKAGIHHFTREVNTTFDPGKVTYTNPFNEGPHKEYYSGRWGEPDAVINAAFAGDSMGKGGFVGKQLGFFANEGNMTPKSLTIKDIIEPNTITGLVRGQPLNETLFGRTTGKIASALGGEAGNTQIQLHPYSHQLLKDAVNRGMDLNNVPDVLKWLHQTQGISSQRDIEKVYKAINLTTPIKYPAEGGLLNSITK